jgi:hypothetical protein
LLSIRGVNLNETCSIPFREGVHPVAQQAFTKVGPYMAAKLAEKHGPARLNTYAALGGLAFLEDFWH